MADEDPHKKEANELRLVAAEIIRRLYVRKELSQLKLLRMQCDRSVEEIEKHQPKESDKP
jgi:hypothetical protein